MIYRHIPIPSFLLSKSLSPISIHSLFNSLSVAAPLIRIPFSPSSHGLPPFFRHTKASLLLFGKSDPPSPFSSSSFHSHPIPRGGGGEADGAAAEASFLSQPTLLSHIEIRGGQEIPQMFHILFFWGKHWFVLRIIL